MVAFPPTKKFSLQLHITSLFTILIIISGVSLGWYSYSQLSQNMIHSGKTLFKNSSTEMEKKINREPERIQTILKILRASKLTEIISKEKKIELLPVLSEMLKGPQVYQLCLSPTLMMIFSCIKKYPRKRF